MNNTLAYSAWANWQRRCVRIQVWLGIFAFFAQILVSQEAVDVPKSDRPVMIDGKIASGEWNDAAQFQLDDKVRVYVKESPVYVWMAVEYLAGDNFALDFYLQPSDGSLYDLHSSAKLGERRLHGAVWPEEWTWWNNDGWTANWSRVDSFEKRQFLPTKVREFQISRARFGGKMWRVMFELLVPSEPQWKTIALPKGAAKTSSEHWLVFKFR